MQHKKIIVDRKKHIGAVRVCAWFGKILVYGTIVLFILALAFIGISYIVICFKDKHLAYLNELLRFISNWYVIGESGTSSDFLTVVVASASILLTFITLWQAHYNREQDRVMSFPGNYLDYVSIGLDVKNNWKVATKYFESMDTAETLLEFGFKDSFSSYYVAQPYRLYIFLDKSRLGERNEWEEIEINSFQGSNLLDLDPKNYEILIEGRKSKLLKEYCSKGEKDDSYKMEMILDIVWKNNLIPFWRRSFANIYIRERIHLNREAEPQKKKGLKLFADNYRIYYTKHERASLFSGILWCKCLYTKLIWKYKAKTGKKQLEMLGNRR